MLKKGLFLLIVIIWHPVFGQDAMQKWDISLTIGSHQVNMDKVNNSQLINLYHNDPNYSNTDPMTPNGYLFISLGRKVNSFLKISLSAEGLSAATNGYFDYPTVSDKHDTTNVTGALSVFANAAVFAIRPCISINQLLRIDSGYWTTYYIPTLEGEFGYGLCDLIVMYSYEPVITNLTPHQNIYLSGNGLVYGGSAKLDLVLHRWKHSSFLVGGALGYEYFKSGALSGNQSDKYPGLNLDFSGFYLAINLKIAY
jgi:hypothetical protein